MRPLFVFIASMFWLNLSGCDKTTAPAELLPSVPIAERVTISNDTITNVEAPIPPQCYTNTENHHNPCYTCHQIYDRTQGNFRMNELDDGGLQGAYLFSEEGQTNHWKNLFVDRRPWLEKISDDAINTYVNRENYSALATHLSTQHWQGFIPDLQGYDKAAQAFDAQGIAKDNSHWVAFNYKPFPGTFWPTNGSTDDVVIRLPAAFREHAGHYDRALYLANLSLVELNIKQLPSISIPPLDENTLGIDINGDSALTTLTQLTKRDFYLGDAQQIPIVPQQYPQDVELMHSVRYIGIDKKEKIVVPARMKELRYMKKIRVLEQYDIASRYARERKEKNQAELPNYNFHNDKGMENGFGWILQGFIENYNGELRPQSYEETFYCMGCHAAIGATIDHSFALARKITGTAGWGYINLHGMPDAPSVSEVGGDIANYFRRAGGGSEFRENSEIVARWFTSAGTLNDEKIAAADVYTLITPSPERARKLNKAYTQIVRTQSYIHGRDANLLPAHNVFRTVDESAPPLAPEFRFYNWDIRLQWPD